MSDNLMMIHNARVSFPHLFTNPVINGEEGKCGAVLMLDLGTHKQTIAALKQQVEALIKSKFQGRKLPDDRLCLRRGEDKARAEYDGYIVLSANSRTKPIVIDATGAGVITSEDDCRIYGGCYVNAKVQLWAQDNKYGKRINADLIAIQFAADGDPFDDSYVSVDTAMEGFAAAGELSTSNTSGEDMSFLSAF